MLENENLTVEEAKIKDSVEEITTTTFSIQGVPIRVFERFLAFCRDNAQITKVWKDRTGQKQIKKELCYSIALAQLLDAYETDAKHRLLFEKLLKLEQDVSDLKDGKINTRN